jgi:hypothetical protein
VEMLVGGIHASILRALPGLFAVRSD